MFATPACPVHIVGKRIVDSHSRTVYRDPVYKVFAAEVKCSGRTWKLLLTEPYFGIRAPFSIDSYSGPWTIVGENAAYFVGWCPVCTAHGTVSLTVTLDGGRHFRRYKIPGLTNFRGTGIRVVGDDVTITAKSELRIGPRTRTVTIELH